MAVALFLADCQSVFLLQSGYSFFLFLVYLAKCYLSSLRSLEADWIDAVDRGSRRRRYQNSQWHLQLLILRSRRQGCEDASFWKFCDSYCSHRRLVRVFPQRVSLGGDWWGRGKALEDTSSGCLCIRMRARAKSRLWEQVQLIAWSQNQMHRVKVFNTVAVNAVIIQLSIMNLLCMSVTKLCCCLC